MATKNIVPRASGEGGLGREDKPWGSIYADYIPYIDKTVYYHNTDDHSHPEGIQGNAPTASKFKTPATINRVAFDGSRNVEINFLNASSVYTSNEVTSMFNQVLAE